MSLRTSLRRLPPAALPSLAPSSMGWRGRGGTRSMGGPAVLWAVFLVGSVVLGAFVSCGPLTGYIDDPASPGDSGTDMEGDLATPPGRLCGPDNPCPGGRICYQNRCVPDLGTCCNDNECQSDSHCTVKAGSGMSCGICIAYNEGEFDPQCMGEGFSATAFQPPADRCHWPLPGATPPASDVVMTPLVIDLDGDGLPEIVFAPQNMSGPERLVAIRGKDCTPIYDVAANLQGFSQLAAGDLDGDKRPEIVGILNAGFAGGGHPVGVFNGLTGALLAQSRDSFQMSGAGFDCSGPALADLDGDGKPEIVVGGLALRWNKAAGTLDTIYNKMVSASTWGMLTLVNDLDGDGKPELITGNRILDGLTGADRTPAIMATLTDGGYPAIGDFNHDGKPDLVLVQSQSNNQRVSVIDIANNSFLMAPTVIPNGWGGPPTVADFDGDGTPDFGTAGPRNYYVFSLDCLKTPKPAKCRGSLPGVLWQSVTKDVSSGGTASSVFDFNGDGRAEVVYRDECWLRVYNGPDGKTVFARPITSGTALEMPIVADVDNDGRADLIVPSDSIQMPGYCMDQNPERDLGTPHTGTTQGIFVLKDPMNRWMPSRPLWNQHTYHITNVNDNSTIPSSEPPNWTRYNNYRQNVQGAISFTIPQPDATGRGTAIPDQTADCRMQWNLYAQICNRGADAIAPMIPGTFYLTDPRKNATPLCTGYTVAPILPGTCQTLSCAWTAPPSAPVDLWFRADDDGKGARPQTQCKKDNDLAFLPGITCQHGPG